MPRTRMVLRLMKVEEEEKAQKRTMVDTPEGVTLVHDSTWVSPPGGWLSVQSGEWDQTPAGVHMNKTGEHGGNVATLLALNFLTSSENDTGSSRYPDIGEVGTWQVVSIVSVD